MDKLLLGLEIFVFILSILICVKNIFSFIKVMVLKEGTIDISNRNSIIFGCAISYIITMIIIGF